MRQTHGLAIAWGMKMRVIKYIIALLVVVLIPLTVYGDRSGYSILVKRNVYADVTAPEFSSATIAADGETITITFSEPVTGTESDTFNLDCDGASGADVVLTYASGSGSPNLVFTSGESIQSTETCNLDFDGDANDFEDTSGNDLADFTDETVTNNSALGATCVTTSVTFWWRCEAVDFTATSGTLDYSANDKTANMGDGAALAEAAAKNETYGVDLPNGYDYVLFSVPSTTMDEEGRFGIWIYINTFKAGMTIFKMRYDNDNLATISLSGTDELSFTWIDSGTTRTALVTDNANLSTGTWYFIEGAWKTSTDLRELYKDGTELTYASGDGATIANFASDPSTFNLGDGSIGSFDMYFDHVIISSDSTDDLETTCKDQDNYDGS